MALSRLHVWIAGETLLASDLNAEINNILNNAASLISPLTATLDLDGHNLVMDAAGNGFITMSTADQFDIVLAGSTVFTWAAAGPGANVILAQRIFG